MKHIKCKIQNIKYILKIWLKIYEKLYSINNYTTLNTAE